MAEVLLDLSTAIGSALDRIGALFGAKRGVWRDDVDELVRRMKEDSFRRAELERRMRRPASWPRTIATRPRSAPATRTPWPTALRAFT